MSNTTAATRYGAGKVRSHQQAQPARARFIALAATLWLAAALAPQAFAASCTSSSLTLTANQWRMVGIPCVPVSRTGGAATVGNVFLGTNLVAANYFNGSNAATATWVLWKRTYTATGDSYTRMAATDPVVTGGAYWLYTKVGGAFQVNGTATPGTSYTTPTGGLPTFPSGTNRYVMYANPWANGSLVWDEDLQFTGSGNTWPFWFVTLFNYVSADVSYWNGNTYYTRSNSSSPVATFAPNEAAWIRLLPNAASSTGVSFIAARP